MQSIDAFFSAWAETDDATRMAVIAGASHADVRYLDPQAPDEIIGHQALNAYVGMFSANAPGWSAKVITSDSVGAYTRATVAFGGKGPDGKDMIQHGQYFVTLDADGKIVQMVGFAGTGAPD